MKADYCGPGAVCESKIRRKERNPLRGRAGFGILPADMNGMNVPHSLMVFLASVLCLGLTVSGEDSQSLLADGFAALVNDRVVTVSDVISMVQQGDAQRQALYEDEELEQKRKEDFDKALEILIERALILEDFEQQKAEIPDRAVDDYLESMIRENFDNDRGAFLAGLAAERMTLEDYREQIRERLIVMVSRQQILQGKIFVAPSAVFRAYGEKASEYQLPESVRYRMMVFKGGKTDEEQSAQRAKAESVRQKILDGADFAETAREHSEDSRAKQGGDWGWSAVKDLGPQFAEALNALAPGGVSEVIEAGGDFCIVKLEERRDASVAPFDEVKEEIEKELRNAEEERIYKEWIARLRKKHNVKIFKR